MLQSRRPFECAQRTRDLALPAVASRYALRGLPVVGSERSRCAEPFAFARCRLERPRQLRKRTPARPTRDILCIECAAYLFPERTGFATRAVVGDGFTNEVDTARRTRTRRVEQIAVARDLITRREPCVAC